MAEEVYYCSDNYSNGFSKEDGQHKPVNFTGGKFNMKLQDDGNIAIENPNMTSGIVLYLCSTPYEDVLPGEYKNTKSCEHKDNIMGHINFNQDNGRYVLFYGFGYAFSIDDVYTRIGTCTKL